MSLTIHPSKLSGTITIPSSKSHLHRMLICASLADHTSDIDALGISQDVQATLSALETLGAHISTTKKGFRVRPIPRLQDGSQRPQNNCNYNAHESGTTFRFMLPLLAALQITATLDAAPRMIERPFIPLWEELVISGATISNPHTLPLKIGPGMRPGCFKLPGHISSQFISGLLLSAPLLHGKSEIVVSKPIASKPYVDLTIATMSAYGCEVSLREDDSSVTYVVDGQNYIAPTSVSCEGDWSNAAFWLVQSALNKESLTIQGLPQTSKQADRSIIAALSLAGARVRRNNGAILVSKDKLRPLSINCQDTPDLVMPLALLAACTPGTTVLKQVDRLRQKESDRIEALIDVLDAFGVPAHIQEDSLYIQGTARLSSSRPVFCHNDHRMCMLAALLAINSTQGAVLEGCECVAKSYPLFFSHLKDLGGTMEGTYEF